MNTLTKDARGFIDGVTEYIRSESHEKSLLPRVQSLFTKVTSQAKKENQAEVQSAVVLTRGEKNEIEQLLARLLGHRVTCQYRHAPAILGGIKITVADWVVDSTLATQLTTIAGSLESL